MDIPKLIGLCGRAQHGKDTIGSVLVEEFEFQKVAFADTIRSMALALNPIVEHRMRTRYHDAIQTGGEDWKTVVEYVRLAELVPKVGWEEAKKNSEVRRFMQALGTEAVRDHLGEDSWVNALARRVRIMGGWDKNRIVITDVRFPDEADFVHDLSGEVWRVKRVMPDGSLWDNGLGVSHPSEMHIDTLVADEEFIAESGDVEGLKQQIRVCLS